MMMYYVLDSLTTTHGEAGLPTSTLIVEAYERSVREEGA
jgi:hypothetical protein